MEKTKLTYAQMLEVKQIIEKNVDFEKKDRFSYAAIRMIDRINSTERNYQRDVYKIHEEHCMIDPKSNKIYTQSFTKEGSQAKNKAVEALQNTIELEPFKVEWEHPRVQELNQIACYYLDGILFDVPESVINEWTAGVVEDKAKAPVEA